MGRFEREDDDTPWGAEPTVRSDFSSEAGHCGCGQGGARCYIDFPCGCMSDHGRWFPCTEHRHLDDLSLEEELGLRL